MTVVKINAIEVPEGAGEELERRFAERAASVQDSPGFEGFQLLRPTAGEARYFVLTWWESEDAFESWLHGRSAAKAHAKAVGEAKEPVATGTTLMSFEVVEKIDAPS